MSALRLQGINVDVCMTCGGLWLDRGELTRLTQGLVPEVAAPATTPLPEPDHLPVEVIPQPPATSPRATMPVEVFLRLLFAALLTIPSAYLFYRAHHAPGPDVNLTMATAYVLLTWPALVFLPSFRGLRRKSKQPGNATWSRDHDWNPVVAPNLVGRTAWVWGGAGVAAFLTGLVLGMWPTVDSILSLVCFAVGATCVDAAVRRIRWARTTLQLETFPFFLGSRVEALLDLPPGKPGESLKVVLACYHDAQVKSEGGVVATSFCLWQASASVVRPLGDTAPATIKVSFPLPEIRELATRLSARMPVYWLLSVPATNWRQSFSGEFLLPVYGRPDWGDPDPEPALQVVRQSLLKRRAERAGALPPG
jgi:hypothetical protein